jgi:hypothetical protein
VDYFEYKGNIPVEDSMKAFISQGLLKSLTYRLNDGNVLEIDDISTNVKIEDNNKDGIITVSVKGNALRKTRNSNNTDAQLKKQVDSQLQESLTETGGRLLMEMGIDISNSYIMLGGYNRSLYEEYVGRLPEYSGHVTLQYTVDISILNE